MRLVDAIDWASNEVLACVGAGGKTTLCWRAWDELRAGQHFPVYTTTTHILEPVLPPDSALYLSDPPDAIELRLIARSVTGLVLARARLAEPFLISPQNPIAPSRPYKLAGLAPDCLDRLMAELPGATWLIEADGARGRGLKWPAAHEPIIPARSTVVVVLASLDSIGQPLSEAAHRPDQLAHRLQIDVNDRIQGGHLAQVLTDPNGGLKGIPDGARAITLLNQSDPVQPHPDASSIVEAVLACRRYERVILAALRAESPVLGVSTS